MTFGGCTIGRKIKKQHEISRNKRAVLLAAPRSSDVCPIPQKGYYRLRPRFSNDSCLEQTFAWDRSTVVVQREMVEIEMIEIEMVAI